MIEDDFSWLINLYNSQCDGDWEGSFGIQIQTSGNPGWGVNINIEQTELQDKEYNEIRIERTENDWIFSRVKNRRFEGNCGLFNLKEVFKVFRKRAED